METLAGAKNLDTILTACPDIDGVWLGVFDTRVSMGLDGMYGVSQDEKEWLEVLEIYESTMRKHGKPIGDFLSPAMFGGDKEGFARKSENYGFILPAEVTMLSLMRGVLQKTRELVKGNVRE